MASRGKPGADAEGDFLGGARSPRPRGKALLMPRHNIIIGGKRTPGGQMGHAPARPIPSERACRARPSGGRPGPRPVAWRAEPPDDAKGGFLGGTHSVRPRCEAAHRPRHLIPTTSVKDGLVA